MPKTLADDKTSVINKIERALPSHCRFVSFVEPYVNSRDKVVLTCSMHGEWSAAIRHITTGASGCPKCGHELTNRKKSQSIGIISRKILEKCQEYGYTFRGFHTEYKNRKSKINIECPCHGIYAVNINNFIDNNRKCPGCKITGFNPSKIGYLYALRSECGEYVKIGISNNPKKRLYQLRKCTPFKFYVIETLEFDDGKDAMLLEKIFHTNFESAGFDGFGGCTEWLKWQREIQMWFRFLRA